MEIEEYNSSAVKSDPGVVPLSGKQQVVESPGQSYGVATVPGEISTDVGVPPPMMPGVTRNVDGIFKSPGFRSKWSKAETRSPAKANRLERKSKNAAQRILWLYEQAYRVDPSDVTPLVDVAVLKQFQMQDAPGAMADYQRLLNISPSARIYNNIGCLPGGNLCMAGTP